MKPWHEIAEQAAETLAKADPIDDAVSSRAAHNALLLALAVGKDELARARAEHVHDTAWCHDCGAKCMQVEANRTLELFGLSESYVEKVQQCTGCQAQWRGAEAEVAASEAQYRLTGRYLKCVQAERDTLAYRLELEQRAHEETKGYRQHAEQQLAEARKAGAQ